MTRLIAVLSSGALLAAVAHAQCLNSTGATPAGLVATTGFPAHDEGLSPPIDMLFGAGGFPLPGGVGGPFTHAVIESNGVIYLTNGGPAVGNTNFGPLDLSSVRGVAGDSPRIMPLWHDVEGLAASWTVDFDTSVPGQFRVLWRDVEEYFSGGPTYSFSATLHASGVVEYSFSNLPALPFNQFLPAFVGISIGNGVGTGSETSVDLTQNADSGSLGLIFQEFDSTIPSVSGNTITLVPNGLGGYISALTCESARNTPYGVGCHDFFVSSPTETLYEFFPDAAVASAALQGNAMILTPSGNGYVATWIPGGAAALYLPPGGGATPLLPNDDGDEDVVLPSAFPAPHGSFTSLRVGHNGIITLAGVANNAFDFSPSGTEVASAVEAAFYSWSDFRDNNTTPVASGVIKTELVGNVFCITWDNVDHWTSPQTTAPSTLQFQFDLSTGNVTYVWVTINTDTTSTFGTAHLVGYTGPTAGTDPGSISLSAALPVNIVHNIEGFAMNLSAAPAPVINPSTLVTYTAGNLPEFVPGSGVYISTLFLSVNPLPGGFDLAGILTTVPGCNAYIATLDLDLGGQLTFAPTASWNLLFDNVTFAPGNTIGAQAVGLFDPAFPLPNGEAGGFLVSNGVLSETQPF